MSDSRLQEIVSLAVVGRAERRIAWRHTLAAEDVKNVLGVRVSGSSLKVKDDDGQTAATVTVSLDLWCANDKETSVIRTKSSCTQSVPVKLVGRVMGGREARGVLLGGARSTGVKVEGGQIVLSLEADVALEITATARMWVRAYDMEDEVLEDLDGTSDSTGDDSGSYSADEE